MRKVRFGVFETNSSSVHAFVSIPDKKVLQDFKDKKCLLVVYGPGGDLPFGLIKKMIECGTINGFWDDYTDRKTNGYFLYLTDIRDFIRDKLYSYENLIEYKSLLDCSDEDLASTFDAIRRRPVSTGTADNDWSDRNVTFLDEEQMFFFDQLKLCKNALELEFNTWDFPLNDCTCALSHKE